MPHSPSQPTPPRAAPDPPHPAQAAASNNSPESLATVSIYPSQTIDR